MATMTTSNAPRTRKPARPVHGTCGMVLSINGSRYRVRPVPCDHSAALRCFELRKADGTRYHVSQHTHGPQCDCTDFEFHRNHRDPAGCKHVKALTVFGMLAAPIATTK